jgi:predicted nuclease of restriction endonuclease-like (RecB) superfamily
MKAETDSSLTLLPEYRADQFLQQLVAEIPWGQHIMIIEKITDPAARLYYLRATAQFGWSRNVLLNQIKAGAYERAVTEKKTHNFPLALPEHLAEQADEMLKSSYSLEYLNLLNDKERGEGDQPSIGIILCAEKDDVEVEYALRTKANPIRPWLRN